jgi:O-antigen/teichoic acid export membrane protein
MAPVLVFRRVTSLVVARSIVWISASRGISQLVSLAVTLYVARLLDPADYGLVAMAGIWTATLTLAAGFGLGTALIQFPDLEQSEINACFWLTFALSVAACLLLIGVAPSIALWFGSPPVTDVLRVLALSLPLTVLRLVPDSLMRKQLAFDKLCKTEIVATAVALPVTLALALRGMGVWALVIPLLLAPASQAVAAFWFVRWRPTLELGSRRFGAIVRYSLHSLGSRVLWMVYEGADVFVLGKVSGETLLGYYSMGKQLALLPADKLTAIATEVATPVFAILQADALRMRETFLRAVRLVILVTVPASAGVALVGPEIVRLALTEKWLPAAPLLQLLTIFAMVRSLAVLLPPVLMARYRAGFIVFYNAVRLVIMTAALAIGAILAGAVGASLAWVTVYPLLVAWLLVTTCREIDVSGRDLWDEVRSPIIAATLMTIAILLTDWSLLGGRSPAPALVIKVVAGATVFLTAIFCLGGRSAQELRHWAGLGMATLRVLSETAAVPRGIGRI